jgi:hypothetical protein
MRAARLRARHHEAVRRAKRTRRIRRKRVFFSGARKAAFAHKLIRCSCMRHNCADI